MSDAVLVRIRYGLIVIFALALSSSISAAQIAAAILFVHFLFQLRIPEIRRQIGESRWIGPILIFIVWSTVSTALAHPFGLGNVLSSQSALLFFFLASYGFSTEERAGLMKWFCIGAAIVGVWGLAQKLSGVNFLPNENAYQIPDRLVSWPRTALEFLAVRNGRAVGPRSHPLTYAEGFIPAFFLFAFGFVKEMHAREKSRSRIILIILGLLAVTMGLVLSEGRGVLLGIATGFLVLGWLVSRKSFFIIFIVLSSVIVFLVAVSPKFRGRMLSVFTNQSGSVGDQQSKSIRLQLWNTAVRQLKEHPIRGMGKDGVNLVAFDPVDKKDRIWSETHNIYLQTALEWGLIGLGLFIWILVFAGMTIMAIPESSKAPFAACFVAFLVAGCTESWNNDKEITMIFWLMLGCADAFRRGTISSRRAEEAA